MEKQAGLETRERMRLNCERYRSSPPICSSRTLTDSQQRAAEALKEQRREHELACERERRYRGIRRRAIAWVIWTLIAIALIVALGFAGQWLIAVIMLQPLTSSVFDALKAIHELRHFDD
jgi:hypothetical protein